jgi:hypothetical protein
VGAGGPWPLRYGLWEIERHENGQEILDVLGPPNGLALL